MSAPKFEWERVADEESPRGIVVTLNRRMRTLKQALTSIEASAIATDPRVDLGLTVTGRLKSGVDPSADFEGIPSQVVAHQAHGVFLETWESLPSNWTAAYTGVVGELTLISGVGQTGGHALRHTPVATSVGWFVFPYNIAFDPSKLYRIRARLRQVVDHASNICYVGMTGVGADGTTLVNIIGSNSQSSQHYNAVSGQALTVAMGWTVFTGYVKGWGSPDGSIIANSTPIAPQKMHSSVRYIRPLFIMNYPGGAGVQEIDYIAIDVFDEESAARTEAAIGPYGGSYAQLRSTVQDSQSREVRRAYAKATYTDSDNADYLVDGSSRRVPLLAHLNASGTLLSKVAAAAAIGDKSVYQLLERMGSFFSETWDSVPGSADSGWGTSGTIVLVPNAGGVVGANILRATGFSPMNTIAAIPFSPNKLYRFRARVRTTVVNSSGTSLWYIGCYAYDAAGVAANSNVGASYVCASAATPVVGTWTEYVGWVKGASLAYASFPVNSTDPLAPIALNVNVVQIKPLIFPGYSGTGGTFEIDYFLIDEFDEDAQARIYATAQAYNGSYGQLKSTVQDSAAREVRLALAKSLFSDPDTLDGVVDGSSYKRVLGTALTSGLVDLSKAGVTNKTTANILRAGTAEILDDLVQYIDNAGRVWAPSGAPIGVGTRSVPGTITKKLRISALMFRTLAESDKFTFLQNQLSPDSAFVTKTLVVCAPLYLPQGATITAIAMRAKQVAGVTGSQIVQLTKWDDTPTGTTVGYATHSGSGWQTTTLSLSEVVSSSHTYVLEVYLDNTGGAAFTDVKFLGLEITYTIPSYDKGI